MMRVDSHHHIWQIARGDYHWMTPDLPIHRDYGLDDLRPLLDGVEATVLVQAAATEAETRFLLDAARGSSGLVRGVVGWTDLAAADAPARVAALAGEVLLKGLRPMLHDLPDAEWILHPSVQPALKAMVAHGLRFDALVRPAHLLSILDLAARHPDLPIVIDHGAKPEIGRGQWQPWADGIARIARETGAMCKLSGLVTEAAPGWEVATLRPYVAHLLECFGPARLMWGSDWPVVELGGGLAAWRAATRSLLENLPAAAREAVMGGTAALFYGL